MHATPDHARTEQTTPHQTQSEAHGSCTQSGTSRTELQSLGLLSRGVKPSLIPEPTHEKPLMLLDCFRPMRSPQSALLAYSSLGSLPSSCSVTYLRGKAACQSSLLRRDGQQHSKQGLQLAKVHYSMQSSHAIVTPFHMMHTLPSASTAPY